MDFDFAKLLLKPEIDEHSIVISHYHDTENPLPDPAVVLDLLSSEAVVICSHQVATGPIGQLIRDTRWHMLSLFNRIGGCTQVWDTNSKHGHVTDSEIVAMLVGDPDPIPYGPSRFLVGHDQHELLVVQADG